MLNTIRMPMMYVYILPGGQVDENRTMFYDWSTNTRVNDLLPPIQFVESYLLESTFTIPICIVNNHNNSENHIELRITQYNMTRVEPIDMSYMECLDEYIGQLLHCWCRQERTIANVHRVHNRTYQPGSMSHLQYHPPTH